MARKKPSAPLAAARRQEDDLKPQRDLSSDHKLANLKTLNQFLLKETMEKRFQIDQLKAQIEELGGGESMPFASDIEREICCFVLSSAVAEESEKAASLRESLGLVSREKDEAKKELGIVVSERDLMREEVDSRRREVGELEARIGGLERENGELGEKLGQAVVDKDEMERLARKRDEAFQSLKEMMEKVENEREEMRGKHNEEVESMRAEIEANAAKILVLEDERRVFLDTIHRLEVETRRLEGETQILKDESRGLKDEAGFLRSEEERLRLKVADLLKTIDEVQEEMGKLNAGIVVLEKEKEGKEREFESKAGELAMELDELSKKMGEVSRQKDELETVKSEQEVEILELKKEAENLRLSVVRIEEMCRESAEKNARLLDEKDAVQKEFAVLEKKMEEKEKGFEIEIEKFMLTLHDLSAEISNISAEKDDVENARAKQDVEIAELKKEVVKLGSNASELEKKCRDYGNRNTKLQDERDAAKRELGVQREESGRLELQVEELKKSKDACLQELKQQLNASLDALVSEKEEGKRQIESLTVEKASLEKSLFAAKEESESLLKKMRAAELISEKALSLLKTTAKALNETEKSQENGIVDDDGIRPFSEEMESIKVAFKSREAKMEEMSRKLEVLQAAVENSKKMMPWLHMLLYPAMAVLAASIFAYAARGF